VTASGTSGGKVSYTVAANTGAARSGTITVTANGKTADFTVTQATSYFDIADLLVEKNDKTNITQNTWYVYSNTPGSKDEYSEPPLASHTGQIPHSYGNAGGVQWVNTTFDAVSLSSTIWSQSCAMKTDGSNKPWRLPTIKELAAIYDAVKSNPAANNFSSSSYYWSASTYSIGNKRNAWTLIFNSGTVSSAAKTNTDGRARCVRSK
jgi:hypothetical protein